MKKIIFLVSFIFLLGSSYANQYVEKSSDRDYLQTQNNTRPEDPPEGYNDNQSRRDLTFEEIDRIMAELVSNLTPEQRKTIRKSNGDMYEYVPPASLKKSQKVKKRKIIEIKPVNELPSFESDKEDEKDIPTRHYQIYEYNQRPTGAATKSKNRTSGQNGNITRINNTDKNAGDILSYLAAIDNDSEDDSYGNSRNFLNHFSLGIGVSTTGFRLDYGATISPNVDFRLGFSYLNFNRDFTLGLNDDLIRAATASDYNPDFDFEAGIKFYNLHTMFDLYPMRNGIFHLTAGLFYGKNTISVDGKLTNPQTGDDATLNPQYADWPALHFADYDIPVSRDGRVNADIRTGKDWIKPYFGLGLGRSVPKGNFSFKLEAGLMYQGSYSMESDGTELKRVTDRTDSFDDKYSKLMRWWPVVNLQLVYRFK